MKKLLYGAALAVALSLATALPSFAQTQTVGYNGSYSTTATGRLVSTNDTVPAQPIALPGGAWATARWIVSIAGSATLTTEVSLDGGVNWIASAYSKRLDAVSANPAVTPWVNSSAVVGTFETPLPGNATNFRIRCGTGGTATTLSVSGGAPYVPGDPVVAVLYDVTEGSIGAGIPAVVFDMSGWTSTQIAFTTPTTQVWTFRELDDTGGAGIAGNITTTVASNSVLGLSPGVSATGSGAVTIPAGQFVSIPFSDKRFNLTLPAGGTVSVGRARVVARR